MICSFDYFASFFLFHQSQEWSVRVPIFSLLSAMTTQIFLPCYFGNEIVLTSDALTNTIYESNWIVFPKVHRQIMFILMERLKRVVDITVGVLFLLNLRTFLSVSYE